MKLSADEVAIFQTLDDDPIHLDGETGAYFWASQAGYGPDQRTLVSKYLSIDSTLRPLLECSISADGTIYYDKAKHDGRDIANMLFSQLLAGIKKGSGYYRRLPRVIDGARVVRPQSDEVAA